jgi:hypothetical protein
MQRLLTNKHAASSWAWVLGIASVWVLFILLGEWRWAAAIQRKEKGKAEEAFLDHPIASDVEQRLRAWIAHDAPGAAASAASAAASAASADHARKPIPWMVWPPWVDALLHERAKLSRQDFVVDPTSIRYDRPAEELIVRVWTRLSQPPVVLELRLGVRPPARDPSLRLRRARVVDVLPEEHVRLFPGYEYDYNVSSSFPSSP